VTERTNSVPDAME